MPKTPYAGEAVNSLAGRREIVLERGQRVSDLSNVENLTIRPETAIAAAADLLSHVLAQIRLTGERVYSCTLAEKTALELKVGSAHVCVVMPNLARL